MPTLDHVDLDHLRTLLADAPDAKAAKRLVVAIAYVDGVSVKTLAARYGIPQSTVYSWLDRFESRPPEEAIRDDDRPGRPPKLPDGAISELERVVADPPADVGFNADEWSPTLLRRYVAREFEVEYSLPHASRLLDRLQSG